MPIRLIHRVAEDTDEGYIIIRQSLGLSELVKFNLIVLL